MLQTTLSITASALAAGYAGYLLLRKPRGVAVAALTAGLLACVALELFDLLAVVRPEELELWKQRSVMAEACLPACWLLFALTYSRAGGVRALTRVSRLLLLAAVGFFLAAAVLPHAPLFYSPDFAEERMLFLGAEGFYFYVALMIFLTLCLYQLERTLVALSRVDRWRAKFEILGVGTILAVLVIYYSQAFLYRSLDMSLMPVRSLALVLGVGMMAFSRLRRGEASKIRLSRMMAYRSVVIFAVGCYLIGLGLFGTGMRYLNLGGNRAFFVALALLGGLGILVLLLSEGMRRRIKVKIHQNFYQRKYDYRGEWLQFTDRLAAAKSREELELGILQFYAETFALRGAALFLLDQEAQDYFCARRSEIANGVPRFAQSHRLLEKMRNRFWVVDLQEEARGEPEDGLRRLQEAGCTLLVPLWFEGELEGFIALGGRLYEGEKLSYEDFDLMKVLAHQATGALLSLKLSCQLDAASEMVALGKVSAFVMHDLKNLVSSLGMVVDNARDYLDDPEFQADMLETLESTVGKMKGLIARLKNLEEKTTLDLQPADLLETARDGVRLAGGNGVEMLGQPVMAQMDAAEIQKVVLNLVINAREASGNREPVTVEVAAADMALLRVRDRGCGMSEEFIRSRLFKPFETTKKKGFGIGLYQCRQVVLAHGGRIEVESVPGQGTVFTVMLPRADNPGQSATPAAGAGHGLELQAS